MPPHAIDLNEAWALFLFPQFHDRMAYHTILKACFDLQYGLGISPFVQADLRLRLPNPGFKSWWPPGIRTTEEARLALMDRASPRQLAHHWVRDRKEFEELQFVERFDFLTKTRRNNTPLEWQTRIMMHLVARGFLERTPTKGVHGSYRVSRWARVMMSWLPFADFRNALMLDAMSEIPDNDRDTARGTILLGFDESRLSPAERAFLECAADLLGVIVDDMAGVRSASNLHPISPWNLGTRRQGQFAVLTIGENRGSSVPEPARRDRHAYEKRLTVIGRRLVSAAAILRGEGEAKKP